MTRKSVHSDVNPWLLLLLLLFLLLFFHLPLPHSLSPFFFFFLIKPFSCGGEEETVAASVLLFCRLSLSFTDVSLSCTCVYSQLLRRFFFLHTYHTFSLVLLFPYLYCFTSWCMCVCVCVCVCTLQVEHGLQGPYSHFILHSTPSADAASCRVARCATLVAVRHISSSFVFFFFCI